MQVRPNFALAFLPAWPLACSEHAAPALELLAPASEAAGIQFAFDVTAPALFEVTKYAIWF